MKASDRSLSDARATGDATATIERDYLAVRPGHRPGEHLADATDYQADDCDLPVGWAGPVDQIWGQAPAVDRHPQPTRPRPADTWVPAIVLALGSTGALIGTVAALPIGGLTAVLLLVSSLSVMATGVVMAANGQSRHHIDRHRSRTTVVFEQESEVIR